MNVKIKRISTGYHSPQRGWNKSFVLAIVDGHGVIYREGKGWDCRCPKVECPHVDAVADLIDDETLERIEAGRGQ